MLGDPTYDLQYVLILNEYNRWIDTALWQCEDDQEWRYHEYDVSQYAGRTITVHLGAYNTGYGGVTAMYVDDVMLMCSETP